MEEECAPIREQYRTTQTTYSRTFQIRMKRLTKQSKRTAKRPWTTVAKRAAAVAVVFCVGFASLMSVEAVRVGVINFVLSANPKNTIVYFGDNADNFRKYIPNEWEFAYFPTSPPEKYHPEQCEFDGTTLVTTYVSHEKEPIRLMQTQSLEANLLFDYENAETESIMVGKRKAIYNEKEGFRVLLRTTNDSCILLESGTNKGEIVKFAENIQGVEK